jgi:hypothetical protein
VLIILIPLPLFFARTVYGVSGFTAWAVIGIIWTFLGMATVVFYPLWESRAALAQIGRGIVKVAFSLCFPSSIRITDTRVLFPLLHLRFPGHLCTWLG